jgi:ComF family protein
MFVKFLHMDMNNWSNKIQNKLYPYTCFLCGGAGDNNLDLCSCCLSNFKPIQFSCSRCGIPLNNISNTDAYNTKHHLICGACLKKPPNFDAIKTMFHYEGPARFLIQSLKYQAKHSCARTIGLLMSERLKLEPVTPNAIIPIPLHTKRLRQRGFNQAAEIAKYLQTSVNLQQHHKLLKRVINTAQQMSLKAPQRKKNMQGAFSSHPAKQLPYVILVDDVVTTGSTANEAAKTLKKAGAKRVDIWAFARA